LDGSESDEQILYVRQTDITVHRRFGEVAEYGNDIAIIKIHSRGIVLNENVQPICIPEWENWERVFPQGTSCIVSGWGQATGELTNK